MRPSVTRRHALTAIAASSYQRLLGANGRVQIGTIGCGIIAGHHLSHLQGANDVDLVAMCDVYQPRAEKYVGTFNPRAKAYQDFRRVLERKDIDAVFICTTPHWHSLMTILACAAGKDVYVEKPMTMFVREGRWVMAAAERYKRVVQVGTQQRSLPHYKRAATDLLRGYLGKLSSIRSGSVRNISPGWGRPPDSDPPPGLDWDLYLGPAAWHPHNSNRGMNDFKLQTGRWFWETDGGQMTNMGVHEMDIVLWALRVKGPSKVVSFGGRRTLDDLAEVPDVQEALFEFPNGTTAIFSYREASVGGQPIPVLWFFGTNGGMNLNRDGFQIFPDRQAIEPLKEATVSKVYGGMDLHERNFLDCVKTRQQPNATAENGHLAAAACHLANLSLRLGGRTLRWDADKENFVNDKEASAMLIRPYRAPWDKELRALGLGA